MGSWVLRFLYGWSAWELTGSAFWVGAVAGLMLLPTFILSPLFGIAADRINPRNGLMVTIGLTAMLGLAGALVTARELLTLPLLLCLALIFGAVSSAHSPIRLALIPRLVHRNALPSAIGYSAIIFNTSRILGPGFGAWLLVATSPAVAWAVAGGFCGAAVLMLIRVQGVADGTARPVGVSISQQLRDGFSYLRNERDIRTVFLLTLTSGLLGRTAIELLPAISGGLLQGDSSTLAILTASAGSGSIIGGILVSRQGGAPRRLFHMVLISLSIAATLMATTFLWSGLPVVALAIGALGLCTTIVGTGCQAMTQLLVDERYRGRVLSLWTVVAMGGPAVGAVALGAIADHFGFALAFAISAGPALLIILWSRARTPAQ